MIKIKDVPINSKLVIFDVPILFTSITIGEFKDIIQYMTIDTKMQLRLFYSIKERFKHKHRSNYVYFNHSFYKQTGGLVVVSPLSTFLAKISIAILNTTSLVVIILYSKLLYISIALCFF